MTEIAYENQEAQVLAGLKAARGAVKRAVHALETQADIDLKEVETQVDLAAAASTNGRQSGEVRMALLNLVADLDVLHLKIKRQRQDSANQLGRTAANRQAQAAYGRRVGR